MKDGGTVNANMRFERGSEIFMRPNQANGGRHYKNTDLMKHNVNNLPHRQSLAYVMLNDLASQQKDQKPRKLSSALMTGKNSTLHGEGSYHRT